MSVKLNSGTLAAFIVCMTPFIDVINILIGIEGIVSFGQIARIALLVVMHCVLFLEVPSHSLPILLLTAALVLREVLYSIVRNVSFMRAVVYDAYYIYVFTFFVLLVHAYKSGCIGKEKLRNFSKRFALIVALSVIASKSVGVGLEYADTGVQRLFGSANALTATLIWGVSLWLYEAFYGERTLKSAFVSVLIIYSASSQGTKAGLIGSFVCMGFILFYSLFIKRDLGKAVLLIAMGCVIVAACYYYFTSGNGASILTRWQYFIRRADAQGTGIIPFLLSDRNIKLFRGMSFWIKDWLAPFAGFNFPYLDYEVHLIAPSSNYAATEMDIFDLFLFYGTFVGAFVSFYLTRRAFRCVLNLLRGKKDCYNDFSYLVFYIVMFLGGHVLNSPFAGIAFCLSYALTERDKIDNRRAGVLYLASSA